MSKFPSHEIVERIRRKYPQGTRIALVSMSDPYSRLKPGDEGYVSCVDDTGTYEKLSDMKSCYTDNR